MNLTQYKKQIRSMSRDDLEAHLFDLFKSSKVFKDLESSMFDSQSSEKLLEEYKKKIERVFWKNSFSLSECKGVLKEYSSRTMDASTIALMHLVFANEAVEVSASFGDFGESFYDSLEKAAEIYLDYARTDVEFFAAHEDEFEAMITTAGDLGYGVQDDLETMLGEARDEVYGE